MSRPPFSAAEEHVTPMHAAAWLAPLALLAAILPGQRVNLAKFQAVTADSHRSTAKAVYAVDGVAGNERSWVSATTAGPHWLVVSFPTPLELGSAHLYCGLDDSLPIAAFQLQYRSGNAWLAIPGASVSGNARTEVVIRSSSR